MKYKVCPICGEKIVHGKNNIIDHANKSHADEIPAGKSTGEYLYLVAHNMKPRVCMICKKPTTWNEATDKYNAFCSDKCKKEYVKIVRSRLKKKYGKENLLDDPEQQKKMLAHRSISGVYHHTDGGKLTYTGSYEKDFCEMIDTFLGFPSNDIIMPSPHVYEYMYKGEKKFYFPDAFIPSLGLEIEIKDGGDNPNMHHKIQDVDKVKEHDKDAVLFKQKDFNYIKIENKNYSQFFALVDKLTNGDLTPMEEKRKIKITPEEPQAMNVVRENFDVTLESFNPNRVADTPEELNDYMNKNIEYGFMVGGKLETEDYSKYKTISPSDFEKYHAGVCWDYVAYEYSYFKRYFKELPCKLYYIEACATDGTEPTHAWLTYKDNSKIISFESAWGDNAGLHEYSSETEMVNDYIGKFIKFNEKILTDEKRYVVLTFNQPTKYNLTPLEYMNYIWDHHKVIRDNGLVELVKKGDN